MRDRLAPLRTSEFFEPVVEYVLRGTGPQVLATLREWPTGTDMVAEPDGFLLPERVSAVADLRPDWSPRNGKTARLTIYRCAPADVLARFGQVRHTADNRIPEDGEPSWLLLLADDVIRVYGDSKEADANDVEWRWNPHTLVELARAGDAPGRTPAHAALSALLYADDYHGGEGRRRLLESEVGVGFLAGHADELAEATTGLPDHARQYVAAGARTAHERTPHSPPSRRSTPRRVFAPRRWPRCPGSTGPGRWTCCDGPFGPPRS